MPARLPYSSRRPRDVFRIVAVTLVFALVVGAIAEGLRLAIARVDSSHTVQFVANATSIASVVMLVPLLLTLGQSYGLFRTLLPRPVYPKQ